MKNETFTPERIKAEADAFFEWDGEDRSLVTTTSCLLFAQHIAGLIQDRAAQPAPVVPEKCADMNHHERYRAGWNACRAAQLAAAPAQGQQVECQECGRLRGDFEELAERYGKLQAGEDSLLAKVVTERDQALAELSALKAQQAELIEDRARFPDRPDDIGHMIGAHIENLKAGKLQAEQYARKWRNELESHLRSAPAQDVAGQPMQPIVFAERGVIRFKQNAIVRHLLDYASSRGCSLNELARMDFSDDDRMQLAQLIGYGVSGYGYLSYASRESVERADEIADALAANHKQSGGE